MTLYIVQAEEGSGIPGTPELYTDKEAADLAYKEAWAEALSVDQYEHSMTRQEFEHEWENNDDFESNFWPEDGGVRMWMFVDSELPAGLRRLPNDVISTLQEAVDLAIGDIDGQIEAFGDEDGEHQKTIEDMEIASTTLANYAEAK